MSGGKHRNRGLKNWFFAKVRSKELKIFKILRAYELKFEPYLGCRAENSSIFWQISLVGIKIWHLCPKLGSKELNHATTGDWRMAGEVWKGDLDCWTYPYHLFRWVPPPRFSPTPILNCNICEILLDNICKPLTLIYLTPWILFLSAWWDTHFWHQSH